MSTFTPGLVHSPVTPFTPDLKIDFGTFEKVIAFHLNNGAQALAVMERRLGAHDWLTGSGPTVADLALFAYTHVADEGGFDLSPGDVPATGLAGLWAVRIVQLGEISPISDAYPITTPDYFLARVEPGAGQMSLTFCDEIPVVDTGDSGLAFVTSTTPALRDALGKVPVVVTLADSGASLPAQKIVWTWGLQNLAEADPLPTSGTDAKVFDQDQDGNPGDTVLVEGLASGKRYMVKRAVWNLAAGTLSGDGTRLSGTLTYTLDEEPLGADPTMLDQKTPITPKDGSTYLLRRVGDLSCATLLQHVDEVFAP